MYLNLSFTNSYLILRNVVLCNFELISYDFELWLVCSDLLMSCFNLTFEGNHLSVVFFESFWGVADHITIEANICFEHRDLLLVDFAAACFLVSGFLFSRRILIIFWPKWSRFILTIQKLWIENRNFKLIFCKPFFVKRRAIYLHVQSSELALHVMYHVFKLRNTVFWRWSAHNKH